jgi:hypothetical protein
MDGARDALTDDAALTAAVDRTVLVEDGGYGGITAAPLEAKAPEKPPPQKPDLVILAVFDRPEGTKPADEIALIVAGAWSPATIDFEAVARTGPRKGTLTACNNVGEFLGALQAEPAGSLSRVVLVSHSSNGLIGFGGFLDAAGSVFLHGSGGMGDPLAGNLDLAAINGLKEHHTPLLTEIGTKWAPGGGEIVFFSCGSGAAVNLANMQEFARALGARARGFSFPIGYCVNPDLTGRGRTTKTRSEGGKTVVDCGTAQLGYRHLTPDRP